MYDEDISAFDLELVVLDKDYFIEIQYDTKEKMIASIFIENQNELSKEEMDLGYMYTRMLNEEFKKVCEFMLSMF